MKYCFCTISIGEEYVNNTKNLIESLNKKCSNHHFVLVTQGEFESLPNTTSIQIPKEKIIFIHNQFNYNLKYLPIKMGYEMGFDYIIFIDSDWSIEDGFQEDKIFKTFNYMNNGNFDMLFERPHTIGAGKKDLDCFWRHKRDFYQLLNTDFYDGGHVANEQFLIFKRSDKLKKFIEYWEMLENRASKENLWAFAEGVEIGMSSVIAGFTWCYYSWQKILDNSFSFLTKDGKFFKRF